MTFYVRKALKTDVDSIVQIHIKSFSGFFLTFLGKRFLNVMYDAFINEEYGLTLVAVDSENMIIGFAAGTYTPTDFFSNLRRKKWLIFLIAAIPGILRSPIKVVKKLYHAMFYKGDKPASLQHTALLSSIAVLPAMSGMSVGKALLSEFEEQIILAGVNCLYLTTDKYGNDSVVGFYTKAGYQRESEFTQPDGRQMLRLTKSF